MESYFKNIVQNDRMIYAINKAKDDEIITYVLILDIMAYINNYYNVNNDNLQSTLYDLVIVKNPYHDYDLIIF